MKCFTMYPDIRVGRVYILGVGYSLVDLLKEKSAWMVWIAHVHGSRVKFLNGTPLAGTQGSEMCVPKLQLDPLSDRYYVTIDNYPRLLLVQL